jgi:DNA repair and recombination protein RAD52
MSHVGVCHSSRCKKQPLFHLGMSELLSKHLVDSYYCTAPFGQQTMISSSSPHLVQGGLISFDPRSHGSQASSSTFVDPSYLDLSLGTADKIAQLQAKLDQKLGPEFISQRPGPGGAGGKLTYAEGWKMINIANEVFGFNGWSSSVVSLTTDYVDYREDTQRYNVGATAVVKVMLRDGAFHEDVGYGTLDNSKSKGAALDKVYARSFFFVRWLFYFIFSVRRRR